MPTNPYSQGDLQFVLRVNAANSKLEGSHFIELDLNPNSRLFEKDDDILKAEQLIDIFKFLSKFIDGLTVKGNSPDEESKSAGGVFMEGHKRISKITLNKNSPATANITYLRSYNGDLRPPGR
ncbi:MAG: hypothetical protein JNM57_04850 [Cyclobacteriaceae bacterium]|nr:hypothetical protein [Cyclobacteriaceae bacterium]